MEIDNFSATATSLRKCQSRSRASPKTRRFLRDLRPALAWVPAANPAPTFQWFRGTTQINGATNATVGLHLPLSA